MGRPDARDPGVEEPPDASSFGSVLIPDFALFPRVRLTIVRIPRKRIKPPATTIAVVQSGVQKDSPLIHPKTTKTTPIMTSPDGSDATDRRHRSFREIAMF